jgi:hypothetical protein
MPIAGPGCDALPPVLPSGRRATLLSGALDGRHHHRERTSRRHRDRVRAINDGVSAFGAKADVRWSPRNFAPFGPRRTSTS